MTLYKLMALIGSKNNGNLSNSPFDRMNKTIYQAEVRPSGREKTSLLPSDEKNLRHAWKTAE